MNSTVLNLIRSTVVQIATSALRALLMFALGNLVARGWLDAGLMGQCLAVIPVLAVSVAWSYFEKAVLSKVFSEEVGVALSLPANSTQAHLDEALRKKKAGEAGIPSSRRDGECNESN